MHDPTAGSAALETRRERQRQCLCHQRVSASPVLQATRAEACSSSVHSPWHRQCCRPPFAVGASTGHLVMAKTNLWSTTCDLRGSYVSYKPPGHQASLGVGVGSPGWFANRTLGSNRQGRKHRAHSLASACSTGCSAGKLTSITTTFSV